MATFSDTFMFTGWKGVRAAQFSAPEDAFQQLIGDLLRECASGEVFIAPTNGRDGGIDAKIGEGIMLDGVEFGAFNRLPREIIVECKFHDAHSKDPHGNVIQGWQKVAQKLRRQAITGWLGKYESWKTARSYVYIVSHRFGAAADRESLQLETSFFPRVARCKIMPN